MKRINIRAATVVAMAGLISTSVLATPLTTNFSNSTGLAYGTGTAATIAQNGIQLSVLQGKYEVTYFPEVNLKDFENNARIIQLDLLSGLNFDFEAFSIRGVTAPLMTLTSSRGGSFVLPNSFGTFNFAELLWQNLSWIRFTYTGTEAKFTSFTLNNEASPTFPTPTPASLALFGLGLVALGYSRRKKM